MDKPSRRRAFLRWLAGYGPARLLLALAAFGACYSVVAVFIRAPMLCALLGAVYLWRRNRPPPDTTHGSAAWADARQDLLPAGMLGGDRGLVVGQIYAPRPTLREAVGGLFDRNLTSEAACRRFLRLVQPRRPPVDVRAPQSKHWAIIGPPGSGKSTGVAIPMLLDCPDSMIVADMKGELYAATAAHRRAAGHTVVRLDPFGVCGPGSDTLNVLDLIDPNSALALDQISALAEAMVVRTGHEKERHWDDSAEVMIKCVTASALLFAQPDLRSLQAVRAMLADPALRAEAVEHMVRSDAYDGLLQRFAHSLTQFAGNELASVLTTASRHLRFLDTLCVMENTGSGTSFDPRGLLTGRMTIYLILPPEFARSHAGLLRLWLVALIQCAVRGGLQEERLVHVLVDEAAVLKRIEVVDDCLNRYRGYGLRLILMYQSLAQIQECWPEGKEQAVLATTSQMFMGVADHQTAELVSARAGDGTVIAYSRGGSDGRSAQYSGHDPAGSYGWNTGRSSNRAPAQRRLITPAEVMTLPARVALVFVPGLPPLTTAVRRCFDAPLDAPGRFSGLAIRTLAVALIVLVTAFGVRITEALNAPKPQPPPRGAGVDRAKPGKSAVGVPQKRRPRDQDRGQADGDSRVGGGR